METEGILEVRKSHHYVGTCRHLDAWETIGDYSARVRRRTVHNDLPHCEEPDPCDPVSTLLRVTVNSNADNADIEQALRDVFTSHGCSHEYDCCGCRSYHVARVHRLSTGEWDVTVNSSRNY